MEIIKSNAKNLKIDENDIILDIETTGLAAKYASIYMIGLIYVDGDEIKFEQWFANKKEDEYEIIYNLYRLIENKNIITFNGDSFDMPFIKSRGKRFSLNCPHYNSIDLIKPMRKLKKILNLENVKLKTVEHYFGYDREDTFTGGMLIELYYTYLETLDEKLKQVILLHNYDDLLGLYEIYAKKSFILTLKKMINGSYEPEITKFTIKNNEFEICIATDFKLGKTITSGDLNLTFSDKKCTVKGKAYKGMLKHFFKDYYNYFYMEENDMAIHKSVGKYIKGSGATKATKENCYIKEDGIFLPSSKKIGLPIFKNSLNDKQIYVSLNDIKKQCKINEYVKLLLTLL